MSAPVARALGAAICAMLLACVAGPGGAAPAHGVKHAALLLPHVAAALRAGRPLNIIAFGSSSTEGLGASSPAASYPSRLEADLDAALPPEFSVVAANRGRRGENAVAMMRRLPAVIARHPDLVIWQTGTNDALGGLPLDEFVALTRAGIGAMRRAGIDVMLV